MNAIQVSVLAIALVALSGGQENKLVSKSFEGFVIASKAPDTQMMFITVSQTGGDGVATHSFLLELEPGVTAPLNMRGMASLEYRHTDRALSLVLKNEHKKYAFLTKQRVQDAPPGPDAELRLIVGVTILNWNPPLANHQEGARLVYDRWKTVPGPPRRRDAKKPGPPA